MVLMILGLLVFLGIHSSRIFFEEKRQHFIDTRSKGVWMGLYSAVSAIGLALIVVGYGQTRTNPMFIWHPPAVMSALAAIAMLFAMVLIVAAYVPNNAIKAKLGHPMLLSVKIWAVVHLLANGRLGDVLLFTTFLAWAVACFIAARKRDRLQFANGTAPLVSTNLGATIATIVIGLIAYALFAMWLHQALIGVAVFR